MRRLIEMVLFLLLCFSIVTTAQASDEVIDVYGGISYNTYSFDYHNDMVEHTKDDDGINPSKIKGDESYFAGARFWLNNNLGFGIEGEELEASTNALAYDNNDDEVRYITGNGVFEAETTGLMATINYRLPQELYNDKVIFILGIGQYDSEYKVANGLITGEDKTIGGKLGFEGEYSITDNLALVARGMYRYANTDDDSIAFEDQSLYDNLPENGGDASKFDTQEDYDRLINNFNQRNIVDFSGFEVSLALKIRF
ncbi:outer membrane beta-barrel protein [Orenia marismortui]|uniref:Outer membrane protein with beta-barrel domain n=1 Tax=Orenia marismortui TaxID=46469 RepID=A0A4R8HG68_9FIRM|nr:outer membrane beta-barrel protein [Orenia marismortui]TDX59195.1 outer membrane protein with beta-barrel domain [Orenia marismortui]